MVGEEHQLCCMDPGFFPVQAIKGYQTRFYHPCSVPIPVYEKAAKNWKHKKL
jgi:hypothetical protein